MQNITTTQNTTQQDFNTITKDWLAAVPPPAMVALIRLSSSSSPRMASWRWRGVIRFTLRSLLALPANSRTCNQHHQPLQTNRGWAVASLGWVSSGAAIEGVTPIFPEKLTFFPHHCHFYWLHSGVNPLQGITPHLFTSPTSFVHYAYSL